MRKVELVKGHFIAEYPVPTAVKNAIEPVYAATATTEFS
jgi:chitin synthase